jgi:hypothetical protein
MSGYAPAKARVNSFHRHCQALSPSLQVCVVKVFGFDRFRRNRLTALVARLDRRKMMKPPALP